MVGIDDDWLEIGNRRSVTYSALAGRYVHSGYKAATV
ncbi:MAG: hypothetical protein IPN79_19980 [Saprospiraceae bacterium]|nr:hypothetical protein [Saprospiraceae bacterium]